MINKNELSMKQIVCRVFFAFSIGAVSIANAAPFTNGSFESQNLASSNFGFLYSSQSINQAEGLGSVDLLAEGWSFLGTAGLSYSNTAWGGVGSDGDVFAFLRNGWGEMSQSFGGVAGDYMFSFDLEQRTNWRVGSAQTVSVLLDGIEAWSGIPGDVWTTYSFNVSNLSAATHTLSFIGTNMSGAQDTSAFVDNVQMTISTVSEPESYTLMMVGLVSVGSVVRRRKTKREHLVTRG